MSQLLDIIETGCPSPDAVSGSRLFASVSTENVSHGRVPESAKIVQSIAYMKRHLTERLRVHDLAAFVNVSPSYYFALFKRRTGYSPISFLIHLRMHHACRLLETTRMSVKEIAAFLGYDDAFYFSRLFKSVIGIAPTTYRSALASDGRHAVRPRLKPAPHE